MVFSKTCHPWKGWLFRAGFQVRDLTVHGVRYLTWRHGLQGISFPTMTPLGVPFGGWCWNGGGCIVQGFFFVEKRMCCFSSKTRVVFRPLSILFFQNMHLSFNLLEGLNLTIPIEMLRCVFLDPPFSRNPWGFLKFPIWEPKPWD